jgi:hypothetical protein
MIKELKIEERELYLKVIDMFKKTKLMQHKPLFIESFQDDLSNICNTYVYIENNEILGGLIWRESNTNGFLNIQAVGVNQKKKGIRRKLINKLEQDALKKRYSGIELEALTGSEGFYETLNYIPLRNNEGSLMIKIFDQNKDIFEKLKKYYDIDDDKRNKNGGLFMTTTKGMYVPCTLSQTYKAISYLKSVNVLNNGDLFMDAGGGDGRVVTLTSEVFNMPSVMIEYDKRLCKRTENHNRLLRKKRILNNNSIRVIQGDFTKINTYSANRLDLKKIKVFYNYINNEKDIANTINKYSPKGTIFLLLDINPMDRVFDGLKHQLTLKLIDRYKGQNNIPEKEIRYMHTYIKK